MNKTLKTCSVLIIQCFAKHKFTYFSFTFNNKISSQLYIILKQILLYDFLKKIKTFSFQETSVTQKFNFSEFSSF